MLDLSGGVTPSGASQLPKFSLTPEKNLSKIVKKNLSKIVKNTLHYWFNHNSSTVNMDSECKNVPNSFQVFVFYIVNFYFIHSFLQQQMRVSEESVWNSSHTTILIGLWTPTCKIMHHRKWWGDISIIPVTTYLFQRADIPYAWLSLVEKL